MAVSIIICLFVLVFWGGTGEAEIYKYVKDGVVHYANRRPPESVAYNTLNGSSPSVTPTRRVVKSASSSQSKVLPYFDIIQEVARRYQINSELIKAIIKVESNYNPRAVSPKGARGLMQLMPSTAKRFGVQDVFDPEENITGGVKFLQYLFDVFGEENLELVLAGYNAGEEAVKKYGNTVPPYRETKQYVKQVMALYLPASNHRRTRTPKIYRYVNKDGVTTFTNVPKVR